MGVSVSGRLSRRAVHLSLSFLPSFCVVVHILRLRRSSSLQLLTRGRFSLAVPPLVVLCGIPTARNKPSPGWTYCLDYNQSKCTYGWTRLPPCLACSPDIFLLPSHISPARRFFFSPDCNNKNAASPSYFLSVQKCGRFPATGGDGREGGWVKSF